MCVCFCARSSNARKEEKIEEKMCWKVLQMCWVEQDECGVRDRSDDVMCATPVVAFVNIQK